MTTTAPADTVKVGDIEFDPATTPIGYGLAVELAADRDPEETS